MSGIIPYFSEDLILNILSRLPVKHVFVCRSVCKNWNFILRTPEFIGLYDNYRLRREKEENGKRSSFMVLRFVTDLYQGYYYPIVPYCFPNVLLSFLTIKKEGNGMIGMVDREEKVPIPFCKSTGIYYYDHYFRFQNVCDEIICLSNGKDIILVNPSTRESKMLPFSPFSYPCVCVDSFVLGVWLDKSRPGTITHYKVFRAVNKYQTGTHPCKEPIVYVDTVVEIYDSIESCWRKSKTMPENETSFYHLLFNGVFHLRNSGDHVITLDGRSETFGLLPLPSEVAGMSFPRCEAPLHIIGGSLALLVNSYDKAKNHFSHIWMMQEYGVKESWTKQYTIETDVNFFSWGSYHTRFWKYMKEEEGEEDELFVQTGDGKLISFNIHTKKITTFELSAIPNSMQIIPYIETLLTLN